jgi:hypothetical protein
MSRSPVALPKAVFDVLALKNRETGFQQLAITLNVIAMRSQPKKIFLGYHREPKIKQLAVGGLPLSEDIPSLKEVAGRIGS